MRTNGENAMLKVGIIGIGNAGNQVAKAAFEQGLTNVIAINSSERDLATVENTISTLLIGDKKGAGKDRNNAKEFIKSHLMRMVQEKILDEIITDTDVVYIISSAGGGTGSGMAPLVRDFLSRAYPHTLFGVIGILPPLSESLASQQNKVEYLQEIKKTNPHYMLYDNGKFENLGVAGMLKAVNDEIVADLKVISGFYQAQTDLTSIDEKDAMRILSTPGRTVVGSVTGFREKDLDTDSIEKLLIRRIKDGAQTELQLDKIVKRSGLIVNLNKNLYDKLDTTIPEIKQAFGEPVEGFEHIAVGEDLAPRVSIIMAGLSIPDDRIIKTIQRIDEIKSKLGTTAVSVLDGYDTKSVAEVRRDSVEEVREEIVADSNEGMSALAKLMSEY